MKMLAKTSLLSALLAPAAGLQALAPSRPAVLGLRCSSRTSVGRCSPIVAMDDGPPEEQWSPFDEEMLKEAIANNHMRNPAMCGPAERVFAGIEAAWVLIFNQGRKDEGVYTLQGRPGTNTAYVLGFQDRGDADRFAEQLTADGFDQATPLLWEAGRVVEFCNHGRFEVSLVPQVRQQRPSLRMHVWWPRVREA